MTAVEAINPRISEGTNVLTPAKCFDHAGNLPLRGRRSKISVALSRFDGRLGNRKASFVELVST